MFSIEELIKQDEGKTLEFKENLQSLSSIIKAIIAFANTAGGTLVIGVVDKSKRVVGIEYPLKEEERLASAIADSIAPLIVPDITISTYRGKELMVITIPHVAGPFYLRSSGPENGVYIRLGSTNRLADEETLQTLKNFARNKYFDELACIEQQVDDLDWHYIKDIFDQAGKKITPEHAHSIGITTSHNSKKFPSNGGIILFGKERLKIFPEAIIRCARFLGTTKTTFLDQLDIESYLPLALDETLKFIRRNTNMRAEIGAIRRKDIPEYPAVAVREAIINAIAHTDYAIKGVYISIAIFDDRLEITNPGGLPLGLTIEKAVAGASRIRNRVIAKVLYHLKWIEQWGSGLHRIIEACRMHGLEDPKFEELGTQFRVTIFSAKKHKMILQDYQQKFIEQLKKKERMNTKEAAHFWKVTPRTARLRLITLVERGIVRKTGTSLKDPQGVYELLDKDIKL